PLPKIEASSKILRIQNLTVDKDENLYTTVGDSLATLLEAPVEDFLREVDLIYRQPTAYTRRNKLPPEVIVKLVRRYTRDCILKATQDKEVEINKSKVTILKDVPWEVRQLRKEYTFLTKLLLKHDIRYKWLYPQGLSFQWEGKLQKIESHQKARAFVEKNARKLGYSPSSSSSSSSTEGEDTTGTPRFPH
ncbi:hypothetical protein JRQ81_004577, partial [Phrynocephalus forsythii]